MGTHVASERSHTTAELLIFLTVLELQYGGQRWGFETNLLDVDDEELKIISQWVSFYKENREFLLTGDIVGGESRVAVLIGPVLSLKSWGRCPLWDGCISRSPMAPRGLMMLARLPADALPRAPCIGGMSHVVSSCRSGVTGL